MVRSLGRIEEDDGYNVVYLFEIAPKKGIGPLTYVVKKFVERNKE